MRKIVCLLFIVQIALPTKHQLIKRTSQFSLTDNKGDYQAWDRDNKEVPDFYDNDNDSCLKTTCYNACNVCLLVTAFCLGPLIHKLRGK